MKLTSPKLPDDLQPPTFDVPDGYFSQLVPRLQNIAQEKSAAKHGVLRWIWIPTAAAIVALAVYLSVPKSADNWVYLDEIEVVAWVNDLNLHAWYLNSEVAAEPVEPELDWEAWEADYLQWQAAIWEQTATQNKANE